MHRNRQGSKYPSKIPRIYSPNSNPPQLRLGQEHPIFIFAASFRGPKSMQLQGLFTLPYMAPQLLKARTDVRKNPSGKHST